MLDIKECRTIKRDYTKNYEGKKIIINVENFPLCYMIITHGDGKSWGYFFNGKERLFLGRANQKVDYANLQIKQYSAFEDDYNLELIGGNDAVEKIYSKFINHLSRCYWWRKNWNCSNNLIRVFRINPVLFANLADCGVLRGTDRYNGLFDYVDRLSRYNDKFDYSKPLIKDACGLPIKWLRFLFQKNADVEYVKLLKKI